MIKKNDIQTIINIVNIIGKDKLIEIIKIFQIKDISKIVDINNLIKDKKYIDSIKKSIKMILIEL